METPQIKRILIRGVNHRLGDSLMTTPAIASLKSAFPNAEIDLVIPGHLERIFRGNKNISSIIPFPKPRKYRTVLDKIRFSLRLRNNRYDCVVLFQRAFEGALLALFAGIPIRIGYESDHRKFLLSRSLPEIGWEMISAKRHEIFYYTDLTGLLSKKFGIPKKYDLSVFPEDEVEKNKLFAREKISLKKKMISLAPSAFYGAAKQWGMEKYIALSKELSKKYTVLVLGDKNDFDACEKFKAKNIYNLAGKTEFGTLFSILKNSVLTISNDSGIAHAAAALSKNTLVIFGPTNEEHTCPYGPSVYTINKRVECSPCLLRDCKRLADVHMCMERISVLEVLTKTKSIL